MKEVMQYRYADFYLFKYMFYYDRILIWKITLIKLAIPDRPEKSTNGSKQSLIYPGYTVGNRLGLDSPQKY